MSPPRASLRRTVALVGLMGVGKTSVGRRLAYALGLPFRDADEEIEAAAGRTVSEIFAEYGEAKFREGERRVIARLLDEPPHILATGGGAFMNTETRALLAERATTVWLKAEIETLVRRVSRKDTRPLLKDRDPRMVLEALAAERHPVYALADIHVDSGEVPHQHTVDAIIAALQDREEITPS
ncbi:MAG: shikimate kinase [Caulobacteraceae bacterium]|nr:shikimate kinase [Caulobacteraceae bacterium]